MFGALKLISWKYTFKRLNEEYEIANKKKQALDKLFENGKISQSTRDTFTNDINTAIVQIEKQQKELVESMQVKTQELENQIKMLEVLLANYEIQHVAGEIDEQIYQQEINLLTTGLETTRNELTSIKQSTTLLSQPPSMHAPEAPQPAASLIETTTSQPAPVEQTPIEVPVEAAPIETVIETSPVLPTPVETAPAEIVVEAAKAEVAPIETAPVEVAPVEAAPIEIAPAPIETAPIEPAPVETAPVIEAPPVEVAIIEAPAVEIAPAETAPIASPEPEVQVINEPTPEIVLAEPEVTASAPQKPTINVEVAPIEHSVVEPEKTEIAPTENIDESQLEQTEARETLQDFEVIPEVTVETTLEKAMEPLTEPINESIIVEEITVPAHPLEAPHLGQTEVEQSAETATETADSNKNESE